MSNAFGFGLGMPSIIGVMVEFEVNSNEGKKVLTGEIKDLSFNEELGKIVFEVVTPHGNVVKLTHREISKFKKN